MVADELCWEYRHCKTPEIFKYAPLLAKVNDFEQETICRISRASPLLTRVVIFAFRRRRGHAVERGWFPLFVALMSEHRNVIRSELYRWKKWGRFVRSARQWWSLLAMAALGVRDQSLLSMTLRIKWPPYCGGHQPNMTLMDGAYSVDHVQLLVWRYGRDIVWTRTLWRHMKRTDMFLALLNAWPGALKTASPREAFEAFLVESERRVHASYRRQVFMDNPNLCSAFNPADFGARDPHAFVLRVASSHTLSIHTG